MVVAVQNGKGIEHTVPRTFDNVSVRGMNTLAKCLEFSPVCAMCSIDSENIFFRDCPPNAGGSLSPKDSAYLSQGFPKQSLSPAGAVGHVQHADSQDLHRSSPPLQLNSCAQVSDFILLVDLQFFPR